MAPMDRIEDCISFLVGKAAQQVAWRARDKLAPYDVTPTRYAVLKVLWDQDGQSAADVGVRLVIDSATITGVIDRLEASGLLERRRDGEDRRVQRLYLTRKGRALQKPLDRVMDQVNDEVRAILGKQAPGLWRGLRRLGSAEEA